MKKVADMLLITKEGSEYTISMTEELQEEVGTIGFVEIIEDSMVETNEPILNLEASKTVLEVPAPLAGKVIARNEAAEANPSLLSSDKIEENWIIKLTDVDEAAFLALSDI